MKLTGITCILAALLFIACKSDHSPDPERGKLIVTGEVLDGREEGIRSWKPGDVIGLSSDAGEDNVRYVTNGNDLFNSATTIYLPEKGTVNFTAYYPYKENVSVSDPFITFSVPEDYMWASATADWKNPKASFRFRHRMSKLCLTMHDYRPDAPLQEGFLRLDGVCVSGRFNALTGDVITDPEKSYTSKVFKIDSLITFIFPPHRIAEDEWIGVTVHYRDMEIKGALGRKVLDSGKIYNYQIDLTNATPSTSLSISSSTVTDWIQVEPEDIILERE